MIFSMSEPKDIPHERNKLQGPGDNPNENPKPLSQPGTQPANVTTEATNMETHAHHLHKVPSHGWSHYLFEFFMLFLAVFCGFLAENQREHLVEHKREKKYMEMLYEDLKKDTADYANDTTWWTRMIKALDTIRTEIEQPENQRNSFLLYRKAGAMRSYNTFQYHDRAILQLKSAGNFRLVKNQAIADSLMEYDALITTGLKDLESQSNFIHRQVNFLQDKIFNSKYFHLTAPARARELDSVFRQDPKVFGVSSAAQPDLLQYYNDLEYYRRVCGYRVGFMKILCRSAIELIKLLKQEYQLSERTPFEK